MDLNEIELTLKKETDLRVCPICGMPFKPYHSRQKTCGDSECKRIHQCETVKRRTAERKAEDPEEYNTSRRRSVEKYRRNKKKLGIRESELKQLSQKWERQLDFDKKISEYGLEYGKRSAEKTLANVPKIDVLLREETKK